MTAMDERLIAEVYEQILHSANTVLRSCKLFSIELLKLEDPSYSEVSEQLKELCDILDAVKVKGADPERMISKAKEYAGHVRLIAAAIETGDEDSLNRHVRELDQRPFL